VKLGVDTLSTVPAVPPAAGPDRAFAAPPPDPEAPGAPPLGAPPDVLLPGLDCPAVQALSATAMITAPAAMARVAFRESMGELRWVAYSFANQLPTANADRASPPAAVRDYCLASPGRSS
jgi:hypothetical protein